jgi:hypothetical protein
MTFSRVFSLRHHLVGYAAPRLPATPVTRYSVFFRSFNDNSSLERVVCGHLPRIDYLRNVYELFVKCLRNINFTIGLCALFSLSAQGNKRVAVLDIDDKRLQIVERLGGIAFNTKAGTMAMVKFLEGYFGVQGNTNHRLDTSSNAS